MFGNKTKISAYFLIFAAAFLLLFIRSTPFIPLKYNVISMVTKPTQLLTLPLRELKKIFYYHQTFDEYVLLRKENRMLKARLIGMAEVIRENSRLGKLLDLKRKLIFSSVTANVVGRDPSNWNATMVIDKGTQDGVELGMPVVNASGVIGKIAEVSDNKSKVILLTDPGFSAIALIQRSREVGLVSGTLQDGMCRMRYLSDKADVQVGDFVISSKLSSAFPEGLLMGEVVEVKVLDNRPVMECVIKPAAAISQIEEVLVIQKRD